MTRSLPGLRYIKNRVINTAKVGDIKSSLCEALGGSVSGIRAEAVNVEHHRAHLGSAFLVTRFEEAVCVSVDGFGDFLSAMWGIGKENKIDIRGWVEFPHSLGVFYTALTQFLGFDKYGDEYKVMGLSAYGEPGYLDEMRRLVKLKPDGTYELDTSYFLITSSHGYGGVK